MPCHPSSRQVASLLPVSLLPGSPDLSGLAPAASHQQLLIEQPLLGHGSHSTSAELGATTSGSLEVPAEDMDMDMSRCLATSDAEDAV